MRGRSSTGVILWLSVIAMAVPVTGLVGCGRDSSAPYPSYDASTRRLVRLDVDQTRDGRVDARTYLDGNRPLRAELDLAGTGLIDRWEYFDGAGQLVLVGTSSASDGIEDTWTHPVAPDGQRRVDVASARDRRIDRREYYRGDALMHAEEDVNGDGLPDKWDTFENGILRMAAFDTTYAAGRPDRRVIYGADGQFSHVEADVDGDGRFERVTTTPDVVPGEKP